jgi:tyrosinase
LIDLLALTISACFEYGRNVFRRERRPRGAVEKGRDMSNGVVANPTYMADIRFYFRPEDIAHMGSMGIDLSTYDGVKRNATTIFFHTAPPNATMPPDAAGKWSADRSQTFKNWIINGTPQGSATVPSGYDPTAPPPPPPEARLRKDVTALSAGELDKLKTAFEGVMARDPNADDGYYKIAGVHGQPGSYCLHHEPRFNPWHRVYMKVFEDALRSVPGCEDVTMPYWDFETTIPDVLGEDPFASYTLPPGLPPGPLTTSRYDAATITANLEGFDVFNEIATSLRQSMWGESDINGYQDFSIQAHDGGHVSIGDTMRNQDVASFDPVFWFFHCNIDRLWLSWQTLVNGTTLNGFKSTVTGDTSWLSTKPFNELPPYSATADETIAYGVAYDKLASVVAAPGPLENKLGSVEAGRSFSVKRSSPVSVRVKGIDRLNIPGSFVVHLIADGEPIAKRAFFQPTAPRECAGCAKHALVNLDFRLDPEAILDRTLSVEIEVPGREDIGARFSIAQAGNPTVNARLLLDDA